MTTRHGRWALTVYCRPEFEAVARNRRPPPTRARKCGRRDHAPPLQAVLQSGHYSIHALGDYPANGYAIRYPTRQMPARWLSFVRAKAIECTMIDSSDMRCAIVMKNRIIQDGRASPEIRFGKILSRDFFVLQSYDAWPVRRELLCCGLPGIK